ncbi:MAG: GAF domain-containing protein [Deltaproteobacteria bacterium]|nr:GAF domain-containing protein [Deltaproteobacteria bacterium]
MRDVLAAIMGQFSADTGTIHRLDGDVLLLEAEVGLPPPVVAIVRRVPVGKGMAGLAAERNAPVSSCNIQVDTTGDVRPGARQTGVNGAIVVPIRDDAGAVRGTLGIGVRRKYEYDADEIARLLVEAAHIRFI